MTSLDRLVLRIAHIATRLATTKSIMKKKILIWTITTLVLGTPIFLIYSTFSNSTDCSQLVIDTYELHSGIDIPEVEFVNCYYNESSNTRISVYELKSNIDLSKFELSEFKSQFSFLNGMALLDESERPTKTRMYMASGEKWGNKWAYVVDNKSRRLWAELKYDN